MAVTNCNIDKKFRSGVEPNVSAPAERKIALFSAAGAAGVVINK